MKSREICASDIAELGYARFYSYLFDYWRAAPEVPEIPSELLAIQPDVTWEELINKFAGNSFTQFILRRIWDRLERGK